MIRNCYRGNVVKRMADTVFISYLRFEILQRHPDALEKLKRIIDFDNFEEAYQGCNVATLNDAIDAFLENKLHQGNPSSNLYEFQRMFYNPENFINMDDRSILNPMSLIDEIMEHKAEIIKNIHKKCK